MDSEKKMTLFYDSICRGKAKTAKKCKTHPSL